MKGENRRKSGISLRRVIYRYFFEHTVGVYLLIQSLFSGGSWREGDLS